jgi:hypothetical protein
LKTKTIKISSLFLDLDNSRFPETPDSQREALVQMVSLQGDRIVQLARDIVENGLDPSENIIVYKDADNRNIVAEGNRRLTTLKLLNQPDIIPSNNITNKIKKIIQTNPDIPKSLNCVVFEDGEDFEHWVSLKHTGANNGAGRVNWTGQEVDRHKAKHGNTSYGYQLLTYLSKEPIVPNAIRSNTQKLYITNINRLLDDPDVRKSLALLPVNGDLYCYASKTKFNEEICKVLTCMLEADEKGKIQFTVNRIKSKSDRAVFLSQLDIIEPDIKLDKPWKLISPELFTEAQSVEKPNGTDNSSAKTNIDDDKEESLPNHSNVDEASSNTGDESGEKNDGAENKVKKTVNANPNRNMLIPPYVLLKIPNKKCSGIFKELKNKLKHDEHPHSIAVMFRVFLELSLQDYLIEQKIQMDTRKDGLHDKVVAVTTSLQERNKISGAESNAIRVTSGDISKRSGALQQYVHNNHMFPEKSSLNTYWNNLEPLFLGIWT